MPRHVCTVMAGYHGEAWAAVNRNTEKGGHDPATYIPDPLSRNSLANIIIGFELLRARGCSRPLIITHTGHMQRMALFADRYGGEIIKPEFWPLRTNDGDRKQAMDDVNGGANHTIAFRDVRPMNLGHAFYWLCERDEHYKSDNPETIIREVHEMVRFWSRVVPKIGDGAKWADQCADSVPELSLG